MHDSAPAQTPAQGTRQDTRGIIPILLLSAFVLILNETTMSVAIPPIREAMGVEATTAQWLLTAFLLTMATVIPLSGFILQRLRTRTVFFLSLGLFNLGTLLCLTAPTFPVLLLGRVVQASGTAVMMPLLMTTILTLVPLERRGRVMGNVSIVISVAPALGPTVSGFILEHFSWRAVFGLMLPIGAAMLVAGALRLKNFGEPRRAPVDVVSVPLSALGFGGLVYALTQLGEAGGHLGNLLVPLGIGVVAIVAFLLRQRALQKVDRPLLDLRTWRNRTFAIALGVMMVSFGSLFGVIVLLPLYLQELRGLTPAQSGLLVLPGGVLMGVMGPLVGRLYDRVGPRVLVVPGVLVLSTTLFLFSRSGLDTPIWLLVLLYTGLSFALGLTFTPTMTSGLNSLSPQTYSHGSAWVGTLQQVAGAAGAALLVTVMSARATGLAGSGLAELDARMGGIQLAFVVAAGLAVVALALAVQLPARPPAKPEVPGREDVPGPVGADTKA
ncbi:MFS transporter [Desertihabitans brevis]|uniref:MFS transporter n=1 Tax=Desertihabitans brevis TaxID=2268447 RepID=A0A367YSA0_9ACTN|nr:MDR family MFS transporter [Desertihabitans brevis]RCK68698.1 MFS transporter [Desertihabitans brevis]